MRGNIKRIAGYVILTSILLLAWGFCLAGAQEIQEFHDIVEMRYEEEAVTIDQLKKIQEGEKESKDKLMSSLLAWDEKKDKTFENAEMNKSIEGSMIETYGDLSLLITQDQLTGQLLYEDKDGVLISETVAYALWGSTDIIGKELDTQDKQYTVKAVLKEETPMILVQMPEKKEAAFKNLRVKLIDSNNVEEHIQTLNLKYNLPNGMCDNLSLTSIFFSQLALIPGWLLGIYILIKVYYFIYKTHHYWVSAIVLSLLAIIMTWGIWKIMQFSIEIPAYMIPNQWSNFDFWSEKWASLSQNREEIARMASYLPQAWYSQIKQSVSISFIGTIVAIIAFIKMIKLRSGSELFWSVLVTLFISFGVIMALYSRGIQLVVTPTFWVIIPVYLGVQWMLIKWEDFLKE